ncbi:MAG: PucR family transcriptional regulator [Nonomuraea sp.]|nr:PucR family transcriptional regulator [Nonomuraea sp.]NUP60841.1 PucR family transcriptional regulator [Nonomuraea sp.]
MAPSLRTVVRRMGLRPLAGAGAPGALDAVVRWVAVSELEDPTPFLEGSELLLTTGIRLEGDFSGYVARLVARGVAGLGFGVGLSHEHVPGALAAAADEAGLPLFEVPRETPFIAIGKVVSELLAAEQYDEITRAFAAQGRLTRAALRPEGMHAVVDRVAKEIDGWAALLDETGEVRHATRGADVAVVTTELTRLRTPSTARGVEGGERMPASLALSGPDEHVVIQPLGGGPRPRGFFAVGAHRPFSPVTHTVINAAGSLLTLAMEQGRSQREAGRRLRSAVLELLLGGAEERARAVLGPLGDRLPAEPLVVLAAPAGTLEALEPHGFAALLDTGRDGQVVVVLVAEEMADKVAREVDGPVGVGSPCGYDGLRGGLDQARRALAHSTGGAVRFAELAGQGLLGLLDAETLRAFSATLLAPLTAYGSRADLVESLRAYLDSNGHWDAAAQRLGIHRHTLRYRMRRVAELLGRDLDDPGVRAELWLALEAARR